MNDDLLTRLRAANYWLPTDNHDEQRSAVAAMERELLASGALQRLDLRHLRLAERYYFLCGVSYMAKNFAPAFETPVVLESSRLEDMPPGKPVAYHTRDLNHGTVRVRSDEGPAFFLFFVAAHECVHHVESQLTAKEYARYREEVLGSMDDSDVVGLDVASAWRNAVSNATEEEFLNTVMAMSVKEYTAMLAQIAIMHQLGVEELHYADRETPARLVSALHRRFGTGVPQEVVSAAKDLNRVRGEREAVNIGSGHRAFRVTDTPLRTPDNPHRTLYIQTSSGGRYRLDREKCVDVNATIKAGALRSKPTTREFDDLRDRGRYAFGHGDPEFIELMFEVDGHSRQLGNGPFHTFVRDMELGLTAVRHLDLRRRDPNAVVSSDGRSIQVQASESSGAPRMPVDTWTTQTVLDLASGNGSIVVSAGDQLAHRGKTRLFRRLEKNAPVAAALRGGERVSWSYQGRAVVLGDSATYIEEPPLPPEDLQLVVTSPHNALRIARDTLGLSTRGSDRSDISDGLSP